MFRYRYSIFITLLFLFNALPGIAQNEYKKWYFGSSAAVDFTTGVPTPILNSSLYALEGTSSIADASGNLLFYTNGTLVMNANNVQMPNGSGLLADYSSTQGALIVKNPMNSNQYYIFTVSDFGGTQPTSCDCFVYSIVDMTLQGGLGDVLNPKNIPLRSSNISKKLCTVRNVTTGHVELLCH